MRRLFQSFEEIGLEYLLISGQATVLYGAAMFSEDVDIWIRLADYDIITTLVWIYLKEKRRPTKSELHWAAGNSFRIEERAAILKRLGTHVVPEQCARKIAMEVAELQRRDREYWTDVIDQLRRMRRDRTLLLEGRPVSDLVS